MCEKPRRTGRWPVGFRLRPVHPPAPFKRGDSACLGSLFMGANRLRQYAQLDRPAACPTGGV